MSPESGQPPFQERREHRMPVLSIPEGMRNEVTGLPDQAALNLITHQAIALMPGQFAEIDMDLDGLTEHNTAYGHPDANNFLRTTGEILKHALRQGDVVGIVTHPHGDEFRMIVSGVSTQEQVNRIIERLHSTLEEYGISGSMGGRPHQAGESAESLAVAADNLMFANKVLRKRERYSPEQFDFIQSTIDDAIQRGVSLRDIAFFATLRDNKMYFLE